MWFKNRRAKARQQKKAHDVNDVPATSSVLVKKEILAVDGIPSLSGPHDDDERGASPIAGGGIRGHEFGGGIGSLFQANPYNTPVHKTTNYFSANAPVYGAPSAATYRYTSTMSTSAPLECRLAATTTASCTTFTARATAAAR